VGGNNCNDFPVWTIKTKPGGGTTTLGRGTAISGGGTPDRLRNAVLAEFNHW